MRLLAGILLLSLVLTGCTRTYPLPALHPFKERKSDETQPPLAFHVFLLSDLVDQESLRRSDPYLTTIPVLARITNTSNQIVVLPDVGPFAWYDAFSFFCSSPEVRHPVPVNWDFETPDEPPLVLAPQESILVHASIRSRIAFLRQGRYQVDYQLVVGYAYHPIPGREKASIYYRYRQDHIAVARGKLNVPVEANQVSRNDWPR